MKKLSKRSDPHRKWKSFKKHLHFLFKPFCFGVLSVIVWNWTRNQGFYFSETDGDHLIAGAAVIVGIVYGAIAGFLLADVFSTYKKAVLAVLEKDKRTFLYYRDERLPISLHLLVIVWSAPLLGIIGGLEYQHFLAGFAAVFSVAFALALYLAVIIELQSFSKSLWFAERIPKDWLEADVDHFFELDKEEKKTEAKS